MNRPIHGTGLILAIPLSILMWAGCAHAYRKACEYDIHVRLTEEANEECHKYTLRNDKGYRLNNTTEVYGCGNKRGIISNGTMSNLGHENMHVIEELCPQWAEGGFE